MSQKYGRLLQDQDQVEHFLSEVLELDVRDLPGIAYKIIQSEQGIAHLDTNAQTINSTNFRDRKFKTDKERWPLRQQIINELLTQQRPENDDSISLGHGGALPRTSILSDRQAYILTGLPASGKSAIANLASDTYRAIILDSDFAKRKLPEYANYTHGATVVHEESNQIIFKFNENPKKIESVYENSAKHGHNLIIPKIGEDVQKILHLTEDLTTKGYQVHLTLISLMKREATIRAVRRFHETKRYVPLSRIYDVYGNDPCMTYHLIKNRVANRFASFGAISTNVPKGAAPMAIETAKGNPAELFEYHDNILT